MKPIPALCSKSVTELLSLLCAGQTTSVEITRAYLDAIAARDKEIHAYLEVYAEDALSEAAASDARRAAGKDAVPAGRDTAGREG